MSEVEKIQMVKNEASRRECFIQIENEYNRALENSNRLDNKVSIVLAFCGVLFLFIVDLFKIKNYIALPINNYGYLWVLLIYFFLTAIIFILYIILIIRLIIILKPKIRSVINPVDILTKKFYDMDCEDIYIYLAAQYAPKILEIREINNTKFNKLEKALKLVVILLVASLVDFFIKYSIL